MSSMPLQTVIVSVVLCCVTEEGLDVLDDLNSQRRIDVITDSPSIRPNELRLHRSTVLCCCGRRLDPTALARSTRLEITVRSEALRCRALLE